MLKTKGESFKGKVVAISGSGNVAQFAAEKVLELGGKVVTLSDSSGSIYDPEGIDAEKLSWIMELKNNKRGRINEYASNYNVDFWEAKRPWGATCDIALPCATQNEINKEDAEVLIKNGCICIAEGANMPSEPEAVDIYLKNHILYGPGKAANAGGVAVSYFEWIRNISHIRLGRMNRRYEENRVRDIVNAINEITDKKIPEKTIKSIVYGAKEEDIVNSGLEDTMRLAFQGIKELKNKYNISNYRTAAYGIAIKKLEKSYLELGI